MKIVHDAGLFDCMTYNCCHLYKEASYRNEGLLAYVFVCFYVIKTYYRSLD